MLSAPVFSGGILILKSQEKGRKKKSNETKKIVAAPDFLNVFIDDLKL